MPGRIFQQSLARALNMVREITWNLHLNSSPEKVFGFLTTRKGREKFWAVSAPCINQHIHFTFPNGQRYRSEILSVVPFSSFKIEYFNSVVAFSLRSDGSGGTDLVLLNSEVPENEFNEVHAGWVSLLLTLKAAVDFEVDLRNHDRDRTWDQGYADN